MRLFPTPFIFCYLFSRFIRTLQGNDTIKYQVIRLTVFFIYTEITVTHKLEAVAAIDFVHFYPHADTSPGLVVITR